MKYKIISLAETDFHFQNSKPYNVPRKHLLFLSILIMYSLSIPSPVLILSYFSEITRSFLRKKFTKNLLSIQKYTILIKWFAFFYAFFMNIFWTGKFYLWKAFNILLTKSTLQNQARIIEIKQEKAQFRRLSRTFVLPKTDTGKKCKFSLFTNVYFFKKLEFFSNLCTKKAAVRISIVQPLHFCSVYIIAFFCSLW